MTAKVGDQPRPPILIVGAGVSGLQTARALLKHGFQVVLLEQAEDVGGVWIRNYQGYGLQVPWELYQFPEFPYPRKSELTDYPSGEAVRDYVQSYARHFGLYRHILFSCRLVSLRRKAPPPPPPPQQQSPPPAQQQQEQPNALQPPYSGLRKSAFTAVGFGRHGGGGGGPHPAGDGGGIGGGGGGTPAAALLPDERCGSTSQQVQRTFVGPFLHADGGGGGGGREEGREELEGTLKEGQRGCSGGGSGSSGGAPTGSPGGGCGAYDEMMCTTCSGSCSTATPAEAGPGAPPLSPPPVAGPWRIRAVDLGQPPPSPEMLRAPAGPPPRASPPRCRGGALTVAAGAGGPGAVARMGMGDEATGGGPDAGGPAAVAASACGPAVAGCCSREGGRTAAGAPTSKRQPERQPHEQPQGQPQQRAGRMRGGHDDKSGRCSSRVLEVVWEAVYEDSSTGRHYTLDASYVVLCTGLYATPFIPSIPGQELYRGLQVHSRDFTDAAVAAGKRVLVVGAGKTAVDVVTELTATSQAAAVTLLYRRPHWPLPRFVGAVSLKALAYTRVMTAALLPHYYTAGPAARAAAGCLTPLRKAFWVHFMGRVNRALGVRETLGKPARPICQDIWYSGQVLDAVKWPEVIRNPKVQAVQGEVDHFTPVSAVLQDGTELDPDIVLYATGYSNHYTFLDPAAREALDVQHDGLYLYRHCLAPGLAGLAFVGAEVSTFNNILTAALQAEWLAAVLAGDVVLPSTQAMAADVAAQREWRRRTMPPHKLRGSSVMLYMQCFHDQLLADMGLPTRRKKPSWRLPLAECFDPYTAADYADVFSCRRAAPAATAAAAAAAAAHRGSGVLTEGFEQQEAAAAAACCGPPSLAGAAAAAAVACGTASTAAADTAAGSAAYGGGGSPRVSASVISRFLHSAAAAGVGGGRMSLSFRMSQAPNLGGFSCTGPDRVAGLVKGGKAGLPDVSSASPSPAAPQPSLSPLPPLPPPLLPLRTTSAAAATASASPFPTAAAPAGPAAVGAEGFGGDADATAEVTDGGGGGADGAHMDDQDTLYSLDALPPALQAFRRTRVRPPYKSTSPPGGLVAAGPLATAGDDFLDGASAVGSPSFSRRRSTSAAMVEPRTILPSRASTAVSGGLHRVCSSFMPAGPERGVGAAGRESGSAAGGAVAAVAMPSGWLEAPSVSSPGHHNSGLNPCRLGGVGAVSRGGGGGGGGSSKLPLPRVSSGHLGPLSGAGSLLLWAGGGRRQRSSAMTGGIIITSNTSAAGAAAFAAASSCNPGGSAAAAAAGAAPATAAAAVASEGPRVTPSSASQGLTMELCANSIGSSAGSSVGGGGGSTSSTRSQHRPVRRGFSLATLLMRNRTNNVYDISSSRMEPSSAAVSELAYKVLPPRHVEEALAATAAAAARIQRRSAGGDAATPPPQPAALAKLSPRPSGAATSAVQPSLIQPPSSPGSEPKALQPVAAGAPEAAAAAAAAVVAETGGEPLVQPTGPTRAPVSPPPQSSWPPPLPWAPATIDNNVVVEEGSLLPFNLSPSPPAAAIGLPGLSSPYAAASSGISYMPSGSTTSFPHWPDALAAAAAANGYTALYGISPYRISSTYPSSGSPAVGAYAATESVPTAAVATAAAATAAMGSDFAGGAAGQAAPQGAVVYAVHVDGCRDVHEGRPPGGGSGGGGFGGGSGGGSGGAVRAATWVLHEPVDQRSAAAACASSRPASASSSSGVSYMPTCSTVVPPPLMLAQ